MSGDDFDRRFDVVAEARRRWSVAEKRKIVAEASVPCANVSAVARRYGVKPALLAIPTSLLAVAPGLVTFTALRIVQGVLMAAAFTLTMAYLADHLGPEETASALASYITGVVASNLVGRLVAGSVADMYGLAANFYLFAGLNLAGAVLVLSNLERMSMMGGAGAARSPLAAWGEHLRNPALRATFAIGFLILFAFIGTFTYVNFVLAAPGNRRCPADHRMAA